MPLNQDCLAIEPEQLWSPYYSSIQAGSQASSPAKMLGMTTEPEQWSWEDLEPSLKYCLAVKPSQQLYPAAKSLMALSNY